MVRGEEVVEQYLEVVVVHLMVVVAHLMVVVAAVADQLEVVAVAVLANLPIDLPAFLWHIVHHIGHATEHIADDKFAIAASFAASPIVLQALNQLLVCTEHWYMNLSVQSNLIAAAMTFSYFAIFLLSMMEEKGRNVSTKYLTNLSRLIY